jgi:hypothetical protein
MALTGGRTMTNELEKQFFDTFGIEPKPLFSTRNGYTKDHYIYPQITDRILLELICMLTRFYGELVLEQCLDVNDLKEQVLNIFIRTSYKDNFKHQVRTLFEEG